MNILQVNSQLSKGGGPQTYMQMATKLLRAQGHQVSFFGMLDEENKHHPDAIYYVRPVELLKAAHSSSIRERLVGAGRALWSGEANRKIQALLASRHFDLAHIHNIRFELSPSVLPPLKQKGLPIVQTLHDYALLCPRSYFYSERDGLCEKCRIYRYYLIIAPSRFLQKKYVEYGIPENKIYFLPNAIEVKPYVQQDTSRYCVYVGGLRRVKGVYAILAAAKKLPSLSFVIVGDGEEYDNLKTEISAQQLSNVNLVGHLSGQGLQAIVAKAQMLIIPTECYENCPMVVLEAYALKRPVIGARIGGIPELVVDNTTGMLFEPANVEDLVEKIVYLDSRPELERSMGEEGRKRLERNYNTTRHYEGLMDAYRVAEEKSR
jgi:glycosyltransferase involved in cell wall biosynthesis